MLDKTTTQHDQTHLGWRTLPVDGGAEQDQLILETTTHEESQASDHPPILCFRKTDAPSSLVEDSCYEGPAFLWNQSEDKDSIATNLEQTVDDDYPLVVFNKTTDQSTSGTVFS